MNDMERFKAEFPEWGDIPDKYVEKALHYNAWAIREEFKTIGRVLVEDLRVRQFADWLERKLSRT